jgi:3-oxoadipate enol-lactonase
MQYCSVNNIKLCYQDVGNGETIVFLHGLGSNLTDWQQQINYFSQKYRVIAVDCRGHGRSDKPDGKYTIPLFADDMVKLFNHLEIDDFHLVGFSMGGMMAFQIAVDNPRSIKSLTIINSSPAVPYNTLAMKMTVWSRIVIIKLIGLKKLSKVIGKKLFPLDNQENLRVQFRASMLMLTKSSYIRSLSSFLGWDVSHKLPLLQMPVLVVAAEHDYTPVELKKEYCKKITNSKLVVVSNSYHATPADQPDALNSHIASFIES